MGGLESIEDVLAAHYPNLFACRCGERIRTRALPDPGEREAAWSAHLADAIRAHLAEVAGRDEVREAVGKALVGRTYANDEPVEWAIEDWLRDADAAVGAYLQAIGDQQ